MASRAPRSLASRARAARSRCWNARSTNGRTATDALDTLTAGRRVGCAVRIPTRCSVSFSARSSPRATPAAIRPTRRRRCARSSRAPPTANRRPPPELPVVSKPHRNRAVAPHSRHARPRAHRRKSSSSRRTRSWTRGGRYDLHIVGYRSQNDRRSLFGAEHRSRRGPFRRCTADRLSLGAYFNQSRRGRTRSSPCTLRRRTATGSTDSPAATRSTMLRVGVANAFRSCASTCVRDFRGDDASRARSTARSISTPIARRSCECAARFVVVGGSADANARSRARRLGVVAAAYVEFVNAEVDGTYWLPAFQRTEFQASFPVVRPNASDLSSRVDDRRHRGDRHWRSLGADSVRSTPRVVVSWAPTDSVERIIASGERGIGTQSSSVHSDDFDRLAPDAWRPTGPSANQSLSDDDESNPAVQPRRRAVHRRRAVDRLSHRSFPG